MKTSEHTERSQTWLRVARGSMQRMVRWLAKRMDEEPDWCKAMMYLVLIYFAIRGLMLMAIMPAWLALKLAI